MGDYFSNNRFRYSCYFGLLVLLVVNISTYIFLALKYYEVLPDSTYFLQMARIFSQKIDIYGNTSAAYTPLVPIILSVPYFLLKNPDYSVFLIIQYFFILGNGFLTYLILRNSKITRGNSLLISLIQVTIIIQLIGRDIVLEPFVLFFLLVSVYSIQTKIKIKYIIAGVFSFLAFWSKQYALFSLPAFSFYIIFHIKNPLKVRLNYFIQYLFTFISLFLLSVLYLGLTSKSNYTSIINIYLGNVGSDISPTGLEYSVKGLLIQIIKVFIFYAPFVILVFLEGKRVINFISINPVGSLLLGLFIFSFSQYIFAYHIHYFSLSIPFILIFTYLLISKSQIGIFGIPVFKLIFFLIPVLISLYFTAGFLHSIEKKVLRRNELFLTAKEINEIVPIFSKAYVIGDRGLIFLCNFNPPGDKRKLSGFYEVYPPEVILREILNNEYLIVSIEKEENIREYYKIYDYRLISQVRGYRIYQKSNFFQDL